MDLYKNYFQVGLRKDFLDIINTAEFFMKTYEIQITSKTLPPETEVLVIPRAKLENFINRIELIENIIQKKQ